MKIVLFDPNCSAIMFMYLLSVIVVSIKTIIISVVCLINFNCLLLLRDYNNRVRCLFAMISKEKGLPLNSFIETSIGFLDL